MGIARELRDYFTVNIRGQIYHLTGLHMGWPLSPFQFCTLTETFVRHLRTVDPESAPSHGLETRHDTTLDESDGARVLSYVDDFLFFASSHEVALQVHNCLDKALKMLGLLHHHPTKGFWDPTQFGHNMSINIDSTTWYFSARADKLLKIITQASHLIGNATWNSRWLPVQDL
jgi:hypothetical protein